MAKLSLKNIVGKNAPFNTIITDLIGQLPTNTWIENEKGNVIAGAQLETALFSHPVQSDDEVIGWIKGDEKAVIIASLVSQLVQKETEKKKLGSEVLNLYQEINVIFNFTEALTQTIEPDIIAQLTLKQAIHSVSSHSGIIVLWNEETKQLEIPAISGEDLFDKEKVQGCLSENIL